MAKGDLNPSLSLDTLFPTLSDESFLQFLKDYYRFLQSTKLILTDVSGTFVKDEVITGADSKATGVVSYIGTNQIIVLMSTETPLDSRESITGSISGATATIVSVKDNVIRESARLKDSRSKDVSTDEFFQLLKDEVNRGYPSTSESDRRLLYSRVRDLLKSKSTEEAYRFLFRAFFNENVEIRFPGEEVLRVSDGNFEKTSLIRVVPENTNEFPDGGIFDFLNTTIRGETSNAIGTIVNIQVSYLGGVNYAEFNMKLVSGEFIPGETIYNIENERLSTETYGIIGDLEIVDGGSGYSVGDPITITGDGFEAQAEVSSVSFGPINKIKINTPGYGYRLYTRAAVDNTDTGGSNLIIEVTEISNTYTVSDGSNSYVVGDASKIQIIGRGKDYFKPPVITLEDNTIKSLGLLSEKLITIANAGIDYAVGEILTFTGGAGANAEGEVASVGNTSPYGEENILFEDDFILLQEQEVNGNKSSIKSEDWTNIGPVLRIELTNSGDGYTNASLPELTIESGDTVSGNGATFTVDGIQGTSANVTVDIANNAVGIGSIRQVNIINPGISFSSANVDVSSVGDGNANLIAEISGISINQGSFRNDDGKLNVKVIQDSLFYQDFSYVIRSGLIIDAYQELIKETLHPAGLEFFGEIVITSLISARAIFTTTVTPIETPITFSSFVSLWPAYAAPPPVTVPVEIEIAPSKLELPSLITDQSSIDALRIIPVAIDAEPTIIKEFIEKIHLNIDVGLFPIFSDVITGELEIIPVEVYIQPDLLDSVIDTHREYQIKLEPIKFQQPLSIASSEKKIEISPNIIDVAIDIDRVKTFEYLADQFGEYTINFFAENLISTYSSNTFLDFTGLDEEQVFRKRIDVQGLEIDIQLTKDLTINASSEYNKQIPAESVNVSIISSTLDEIVAILNLYVDVSPEIVYNDVQIIETSIADVVIQIVSKAQSTEYWYNEIIADHVNETIEMFSDKKLRDLYVRPLSSPGFDNRYEIDITPTKINSVENPFIDFLTKIRDLVIPIDADIAFDNRYEIDINPEVVDLLANFKATELDRPRFIRSLTQTVAEFASERVVDISPYIDVSLDIVYNNIEIVETSLSDIVIQIYSGYDTIGSYTISSYESQTISYFADESFSKRFPLGKSNFTEKFWNIKDLSFRGFIEEEIQTFANDPIDSNLRISKNVQRNLLLEGTSDFVDPSFSNQRIFRFSDDEIDTYSANTFSDLSGLKTTVVGTNTEFTIEYRPGESLITQTEKFIVTSVANNTHLEVNVNPDQNYDDAAVYREFYV